MSSKVIHLIYIHGFQGNDTTFQSFPTDLHKHLVPLFPPHLEIKSSLYPTYKCVKPLAHATLNFLQWLTTQPPGPVILMGHSMGGLLAADAATDPTNLSSHRIVGMIAFDTPYLGMHPHVVISGLASLVPKKEPGDKTAGDMNPGGHVAIVDDAVTDDWANFKSDLKTKHEYKSSVSLASPRPGISPKPSSSSLAPPTTSSEYVERALANPFVNNSIKVLSLFSSNDQPVIKWARKHADDPFNAGKAWVVDRFQFGIGMFDPSGLRVRYAKLVGWSGLWTNYWTETLPQKKGTNQKAVAGKEVREEWIRENDQALIETGAVEPPSSEVERISITVEPPPTEVSSPPVSETGPSVPTEAPTEPQTEADVKKAQKEVEKVAKAAEKARQEEIKKAEKAEKARLKAIQKEQEAEAKRIKSELKKGIIPPRHFIVLPTGLGAALGGGENWEKVEIAGVQDEVAAHTGLFIRDQNLDYDGLVARVGKKVLDWCVKL